ncbi:MAG: hypothetical protein ACXVA9_12090 [Bdellovibrionales bacterium]
MRIALFFLFLATAAFADPPPAKSAGPQATVWSRHPDAIRKFFPAAKYRMLDGKDFQKEQADSGYILPQQRDALFRKLGLEAALTSLDDMDKDMLVMGARFEELPSLRKNFPMLTETQIKNLQQEVKELAQK